jgi:hypothetical protein
MKTMRTTFLAERNSSDLNQARQSFVFNNNNANSGKVHLESTTKNANNYDNNNFAGNKPKTFYKINIFELCKYWK